MTQPGSSIVPIQNASASPQIVPPYQPRLNSDGRAEVVHASFDPQLLSDATRDLRLVENTAHSTGVGPVLKALLLQSGLAFTVRREIFPDGARHASGDAIDVTSGDLLSIAQFLVLVPTLFSEVTFTDKDYAVDCLYIADGATNVAGSVETSELTSIHIASTLQRMHAEVLTAAVRDALTEYASRLVYDVPTAVVPGLPNDGAVGFW